MVSLLGECGFKLHGLFIVFYQVVVCDVFSKESIIFISFHKKVWRYDDVITISWQNQWIIIVYSIFLKCLNEVSWEILYATKINVFWKKKQTKRRYFLYHVLLLLLWNNTTISPKKMTFHKNPYLAF